MEQINQYLPLVIAVGVIVVIALMIVIALGQRKLFKNIISNKFSMTDIEEVNIHTGKKTYAVIVSNKSMNDAGITAVGVVSGLKYFDFKDTYREMNEVSGDTLVIMPRSPIKLVLETEDLERLIFSNLKNGKFLPVKTYVIDSTGTIFLQRAKNFHKILKAHYRDYLARVKAAALAAEREKKLKGDYEFAKTVEGNKDAPLKDKIKIKLLKKVSESDIAEAEKAAEAAKKLAERYSVENEAAETSVQPQAESAENETAAASADECACGGEPPVCAVPQEEEPERAENETEEQLQAETAENGEAEDNEEAAEENGLPQEKNSEEDAVYADDIEEVEEELFERNGEKEDVKI